MEPRYASYKVTRKYWDSEAREHKTTCDDRKCYVHIIVGGTPARYQDGTRYEPTVTAVVEDDISNQVTTITTDSLKFIRNYASDQFNKRSEERNHQRDLKCIKDGVM